MSLAHLDSVGINCDQLGIFKKILIERPKVGLEVKDKWDVWASMGKTHRYARDTTRTVDICIPKILNKSKRTQNPLISRKNLAYIQ